MKKLIPNYLLAAAAILLLAAPEAGAVFTEPDIANYSATPVTITQSAPPNILVILDNSLSMSWGAYNGKEMGGSTQINYVPTQLNEKVLTYSINSSTDDAEELWYWYTDGLSTSEYHWMYLYGLWPWDSLHLGRYWQWETWGSYTYDYRTKTGLRFRDIALPKGAEVLGASIKFQADSWTPVNSPEALDEPTDVLRLRIAGQAADDPPTFSWMDNDISNRPRTAATVAWNQDHIAEPWVPGNTYATPDLTPIVQEIANRAGWDKGNSMAFFMEYDVYHRQAQRTVYSYESSANGGVGVPPQLEIRYRSEDVNAYYGYFNSDWFYIYDGQRFKRVSANGALKGYKKVALDRTGKLCAGAAAASPKWLVRYPGPAKADYDSPPADESSWPTACIGDAEIATQQLWDGNFLNWATMKRIDVARKVLTGGKGASIGFQADLLGDSIGSFDVTYDTSAAGVIDVTPYNGTQKYSIIGNSTGGADTIKYCIASNNCKSYDVHVDLSTTYEPDAFTSSGKLGGVLQTFMDQAYWGIEYFNPEPSCKEVKDKKTGVVTTTCTGPQGGIIAIPLADHSTNANFISSVNAINPETYTPPAEALYVALKYYEQQDPGTDYKNTVPINPTSDPFQRHGQDVSCVRNFVLLITDGEPTKDNKVPATIVDENGATVNLLDYDGDKNANDKNNDTSDALDDVALFMHNNDLRNNFTSPTKAVLGKQNVDTYAVYTFGNNAVARILLQDTARNGSFEDSNGNKKPDLNLPVEWDKDGDGVPDNYYEASDGAQLKRQLTAAISNILAKAASGTSVSVLSTSSEGEGVLVQAYFEPKTTGDADGLTETRWVGHLQALWVDSKGNLREDAPFWGNDPSLDITADNVITYSVVNGDAKINRFAVSADTPYPDTATATPETVAISQLRPIWEAGEVLAVTSPDDRKIFTSLDTWWWWQDLFGGQSFEDNNLWSLMPYLGLEDDTKWAYLGTTQQERARNLIRYIRGWDTGFSGIPALRNRTIKVQGHNVTWKLGDIVNATPITVQAPPEGFHLIYADKSYDDYRRQHRPHRNDSGDLAGWETMVYAGANDGMLHAFTGWKYDRDAKAFRQPGFLDVTGTYVASENIGQELWAYIPRALLPHLKWLPSGDYLHTYYVDMTPKVTDMKVFPPDADWHINGWGTVLIGGLGMGGKDIQVNTDANSDGLWPDTFKPTYFAIDITNPRSPRILWEKSYAGLGFSMSRPAVIKVNDKWYLAFGSGPDTTDYNGNSAHPGRIFVVDAATGAPVTNALGQDYLFDLGAVNATNKFTGVHGNAFMSTGTAFDFRLNYSVDAFYIGETYNAGNLANPSWKGGIYKVVVPWRCVDADCNIVNDYGTSKGQYVDNPKDGINPWLVTRLFDSPGPVTAPLSLSYDSTSQQVWVYFGTGRLLSEADKSNTDPQDLYGLKDPFFNRRALVSNPDTVYAADYFRSYTNYLTLTPARLFDADGFKAFFPWTANPSKAPTGTCDQSLAASNPYYMIGDVYGDDSCLSMRWDCVEVTPGACAAAVIGQEGDINGDGSCTCARYLTPADDWMVKADDPMACADIKAGEVGDIKADQTCIGMNWGCVEAFETACWSRMASIDPVTGNPIPIIDPDTGLEIPLADPEAGFIGDYYKDGSCVCSGNVEVLGATVKVIDPPERYYWARPAGDCANVKPGMVGIFDNPAGDGGYCKATYWTCDEDVAGSGACQSIDYFDTTSVDVEALTAANPGCTCREIEEPVAYYVNTMTGSAINPLTDKPYEFKDILGFASVMDGWKRAMVDIKERSLTRAAVLGGAVFFTTFVPTTDACSFGGNSFLWALYYLTGTAFNKPIIGTYMLNGVVYNADRIGLGYGLASSLGIHIGFEGGNAATTYIQQSTSAITMTEVTPPEPIRSGVVSWRER